MNKEQLSIRQAARQAQYNWPACLSSALKPIWQKTLSDDANGLISGWPLKILEDISVPATVLIKKYAQRLGAAALYFWTAANLQDDLSDSDQAPKEYLPLANACWQAAWHLSFTSPSPLNLKISRHWQKNLLLVEAANFQELKNPQLIPTKKLAPAGKSAFLLAGPILLLACLNWTPKDQQKFNLAGRYALAAKQLADDVYDYREDWQAGRRTAAHQGLKNLPDKNQLPAYYYRQALNILNLSRRARTILKTVSALKQGNCFDDFLQPLETNSRRFLASAAAKHYKPANQNQPAK